MSYENLLLEIEGGVAKLTINRPKVMNALNDQTLRELASALDECKANDDVRCVVLTGAGEKAFVAGADIGELAEQSPLSARPLAMKGQKLMDTIEACPKPVVAAINGYALGGGCELALACHMRYGSDNAVLGLPEVTLGIIPGYGGTQRLPRVVGKGRAMELILSAKPIDAEEAYRIGLLNKVFPQAELMNETRTALSKMTAKAGPVALRFALDAVNHGTEMPLGDGLNYEATFFGLLTSTSDVKEGMTAFLERRPAKFTGN